MGKEGVLPMALKVNGSNKYNFLIEKAREAEKNAYSPYLVLMWGPPYYVRMGQSIRAAILRISPMAHPIAQRGQRSSGGI